MKNGYLWLGLLIGLVIGGGTVAIAQDCPPAEVIDCPVEVVIDMDVLDRYCPDCGECPEPVECPEIKKADCPPPRVRHPIEVRPAYFQRHRFDLTGLVATDGDAAALALGWNWPVSSRWTPVIGLMWVDGTPGTYYHGRVKGGTDDDLKVAAGFRWSFL